MSGGVHPPVPTVAVPPSMSVNAVQIVWNDDSCRLYLTPAISLNSTPIKPDAVLPVNTVVLYFFLGEVPSYHDGYHRGKVVKVNKHTVGIRHVNDCDDSLEDTVFFLRKKIGLRKQNVFKLPPPIEERPKKRARKSRCPCPKCLHSDCGKCKYCRDKPKFGGLNTLRKRCTMRTCALTTSSKRPRVATSE